MSTGENLEPPLIGTCNDCGRRRYNVYHPKYTYCSVCKSTRFTFVKQVVQDLDLPGDRPVHGKQTF